MHGVALTHPHTWTIHYSLKSKTAIGPISIFYSWNRLLGPVLTKNKNFKNQNHNCSFIDTKTCLH